MSRVGPQLEKALRVIVHEAERRIGAAEAQLGESEEKWRWVNFELNTGETIIVHVGPAHAFSNIVVSDEEPAVVR